MFNPLHLNPDTYGSRDTGRMIMTMTTIIGCRGYGLSLPRQDFTGHPVIGDLREVFMPGMPVIGAQPLVFMVEYVMDSVMAEMAITGDDGKGKHSNTILP